MNTKIKLGLILIIFIVTINSCFKSYSSNAYIVRGTKTNVTIKFRDISEEGFLKDELTTSFTNVLPWGTVPVKVFEDNSRKREPLFVSAYSESEGELIVIIYNVSEYYTVASNFTTNSYAEVYGEPKYSK